MPREPKPPPDDPEQSKRFIEAARAIGTDESPEVFELVFKKIAEYKVTTKATRKRAAGNRDELVDQPLTLNSLQTVRVLGSSVARAADGTTALILETDHIGSIAFEVDPGVIAVLQKQLALAEIWLHPPSEPEETAGIRE
jgi:hypothetical protein